MKPLLHPVTPSLYFFHVACTRLPTQLRRQSEKLGILKDRAAGEREATADRARVEQAEAEALAAAHAVELEALRGQVEQAEAEKAALEAVLRSQLSSAEAAASAVAGWGEAAREQLAALATEAEATQVGYWGCGRVEGGRWWMAGWLDSWVDGWMDG